jgi:hypothetical protein
MASPTAARWHRQKAGIRHRERRHRQGWGGSDKKSWRADAGAVGPTGVIIEAGTFCSGEDTSGGLGWSSTTPTLRVCIYGSSRRLHIAWHAAAGHDGSLILGEGTEGLEIGEKKRGQRRNARGATWVTIDTCVTRGKKRREGRRAGRKPSPPSPLVLIPVSIAAAHRLQ